MPPPRQSSADTRATLAHAIDFSGWRAWTRALIARDVRPQDVLWEIRAPDDLFSPDATIRDLPTAELALKLPRALVAQLQAALLSGAEERFETAHAAVLGVWETGPDLLRTPDDPRLSALNALAERAQTRAASLRRALLTAADDARAEVTAEDDLLPSQITALGDLTPKEWIVSAPTLCIRKSVDGLFFARAGTNDPDAFIRNVYWSDLPPLPPDPVPEEIAEITRLDLLRLEAAHCHLCPLWEPATRTVFGVGRDTAPLMLVGEQPGDQEDLSGIPFVGPAGKLLDASLARAGIDRDAAYVTNAVKHFRFEQRGKRRIHQKPGTAEVHACAPWLSAERRLVKPRVLVMLGATAAQAVLGRAITIGRERGRPIDLGDGTTGFVTVHPSYLLRLPDPERRAEEERRFVDDLRAASALLDA